MPESPGTRIRLEHVRVSDCMHRGIVSCPPDAPLAEVAALMVKHRIHAVAVTNGNDSRPAGVISDLDIVAAAATGDAPTAREAAATEPLGVSADERLDRAAQLMSEHAVSHLVVLDAASGYPVGVLSTLDIAAIYGGGNDQ